MKIAEILPGRIWGGAEQVALDLAHGLRRRGHEVRVVAHDNGVLRHRLSGEPGVAFLPLRSRLPLRALPALARELRDAEAVHVHSTGLVPLVALALRLAGSRARLVVTRHDARSHAVPLWSRPAYRRVAAIVFVSALGRRLWREKNGWFASGRCHAVLNRIPPADTPAGPVPSLRTLYGIGADTPLLLFAGRMRATKGCADIVAALSRLRDRRWAMVFVGAPKPADYGERLAAMAREGCIADRVFFHPFTPDARSLMRQADLCLAPSTFVENCPLSPMEAMQAGRCVIASDNGGQPEFIQDGLTGILVPPGRPDRLADSIAAMLDSPRRRDEIGARAARFVAESLSFDAWIDSHLTLYGA